MTDRNDTYRMIRLLRIDAEEHGSTDTQASCRRALAGDADALAECRRAADWIFAYRWETPDPEDELEAECRSDGMSCASEGCGPQEQT